MIPRNLRKNHTTKFIFEIIQLLLEGYGQPLYINGLNWRGESKPKIIVSRLVVSHEKKWKDETPNATQDSEAAGKFCRIW